jgi:LysR family transcriptional regulator, low CO2-responsive transcriptional regulator
MTMSQIRAFRLVAHAGSFTQASRAAGISQPTLSAQVKGLESAYRVQLFEREKRGVKLTQTGRNLLPIADRIFAAEEEAQALLAGAESGIFGELRVAADSAYHVMPILADLRQQHTNMTFSLKVANSERVLAYVLDGSVDVAVTAKQVSDPRLHVFRLKRDKLILFVTKAHHWANRRSVRLAALEGEALVIRERGSTTREVFEARMAEIGVRAGALIEVETREGVREGVAAGFGIGVVFESEFGADKRFCRIDVAATDLSVAEYVVCREQRRSQTLVRSFLERAAIRAA